MRIPIPGRTRRSELADTARTRETFDAWARDGRERKMEVGHGPIARRVFESLRLAEDARYLDIGCGNGYTGRWAAEAAPRGEAVGLDLSPLMIRRARELTAGIPNAAFVQAAFPEHEFMPGTFDAIFSMETLYYLHDPVAALSEVCRLLKPGGVFASAIDIYREHPMSRRWIDYVGVPVKLWSGHRWRRAFERAGFAEVEQEKVTLPAEEAVEPWHATVGCLVTRGRRPG
jgi:SAM-dependent methyltransferase